MSERLPGGYGIRLFGFAGGGGGASTDLLILDEPLSGIDVTSAHVFKHLLGELAAQGKMLVYISHVLETVEKVCGQVVILYRGEIRAADSVERLRELMQLASLEEIFSQLAEQRDLGQAAKDIVPGWQTREIRGWLIRDPG
jgi:ABC-2 type transport system ATP-binding protein